METTFEPSLLQNLRTKIAVIEFLELSILGFGFWGLIAIIPGNPSNPSFLDLITFLFIVEGLVLGSWAIYNIYIRIARAGGKIVDIGLWVVASLATGSYTFWTWTILDVNRFLMSKLLYCGDAPLEYAWSARSKQIRKAWEQMRKATST